MWFLTNCAVPWFYVIVTKQQRTIFRGLHHRVYEGFVMGVHWSKDSSSKNRKKKKVALPVVDGVIPKPKSKIQGRWLVQGASERYGVFCLGGQFRWYVEMVVEASTSWGREGTHLPTSLHSGSIFLKVRGRRNQCLFWVALPLQFLPAPSYARVEKPGFHHFREKASGFSPRKPKAARDGKALVGSLVFLSLFSLSLFIIRMRMLCPC